MIELRVKAETEEDVTNIGFDRLSIYRPGLLMCDRQVITRAQYRITQYIR